MLMSILPTNPIGDPNSSVLLSIPADRSHHGNRIKTYRLPGISGEDSSRADRSPIVQEIDILDRLTRKITKDVQAPRPEREPASPGTKQADPEDLINLETVLRNKVSIIHL